MVGNGVCPLSDSHWQLLKLPLLLLLPADDANPIICPDHFLTSICSSSVSSSSSSSSSFFSYSSSFFSFNPLPETSPPTKLGTDSPWRIGKFPIYQFHPLRHPFPGTPPCVTISHHQFCFFSQPRLICMLNFFSSCAVFLPLFIFDSPSFCCFRNSYRVGVGKEK